MKTFIILLVALPIIGCRPTNQTTKISEINKPPEGSATSAIINNQESIIEVAARCGLNIGSTKEIIISSDGKTLIYPPNKFISIADLESCHTKTIAWKTIDSSQGELMDINETQNLYLSHVIVSTSPSSYLAIVAKIGTRENLISLPGAYIEGLSTASKLESSFTYFPTNEQRARISIDGKYATPSGETSCNENTYPGIWNIQLNEKVSLSGDPNENCASLFSQQPSDTTITIDLAPSPPQN